jgi:hypothetical protein
MKWVFAFGEVSRIAPGVRLNIGKKGSSLSVGKKGATLNFSEKGTRATVGIPGSGISYSETLGKRNSASTDQAASEPSIGSKNFRLADRYFRHLGYLYHGDLIIS